MPDATQDQRAKVTYNDDWTAHLTKNGGLTITTATVTATDGALVSNTTPTSTGVMFRLDTSAVTGAPKVISTTTQATLSNGDTDYRTYSIQVTTT